MDESITKILYRNSKAIVATERFEFIELVFPSKNRTKVN